MRMKKYLWFLITLIPAWFLQAQQVIKIDDHLHNLSEQFKTAFEKGGQQSDFYWIGYSIQGSDNYQVSVGSIFYGEDYGQINLRDIIFNTVKFRNSVSPQTKIKRRNSGRSFIIDHGISINDNVTDRETAVLFRYNRNSKNTNDFQEISICNLSRHIDLGHDLLFWLGEKDNKNSINFLFDLYAKSIDYHLKKELIPVIGIHTDQQSVTSFLKKIINSNEEEDLREEIPFWLGLQNNYEAYASLKNVIYNNHSLELQKRAVRSLGYIKLPEIINELINIARHNKNEDLRKHAVYGLGNIAVKKAEEALKYIVEDSPDIEIKKHAVYALANNLDNNFPYLIEIAKNHSSLTVRKSAIWSLSNSDNKKAQEALIELAKDR